MKQTIIKAMTLLSFTGLLTAFVLYRAGVLENVFQSSPNGGKKLEVANGRDSVKKTELMPTSKSLGIASNFSGKKDTSEMIKDSIIPKVTNTTTDERIEMAKNDKQWEIAASSKSITPIVKNPERMLVNINLNLDSLINKPKQQNDSHKLKESQIMLGSKSGRGARLEDIKLVKGLIDSIMKTDSSKIKSKKTPATKTPKK